VAIATDNKIPAITRFMILPPFPFSGFWEVEHSGSAKVLGLQVLGFGRLGMVWARFSLGCKTD
jgi:hypothetical protein